MLLRKRWVLIASTVYFSYGNMNLEQLYLFGDEMDLAQFHAFHYLVTALEMDFSWYMVAINRTYTYNLFESAQFVRKPSLL